jgi:hypothetical protein
MLEIALGQAKCHGLINHWFNVTKVNELKKMNNALCIFSIFNYYLLFI